MKRKMLALVCALVMAFSMALPVSAANKDADSYIRQMINYYRYHQDAAATDIARLNAELAKIDATQAEAWGKIMDYWAWVNSDMEVHTEVLPDGLPEDDSLCIVVLGYALKSNGSMRDELISRLEVALTSAEKYPNAYIVCTGGGTASGNRKKTEAGQMAAWLIEQGIDEDRVIIENKSYSTEQNAQLTCEILRTEYPQVKHLAIVSSDYHIARGCVFFYTQLVLSAYNSDGQIFDVVSQAGYPTGRVGSDEGMLSQATGVALIAGVSLSGLSKPSLSELTGITVGGRTSYMEGDDLALTVTSSYDSGFSRVVTPSASFSEVDMGEIGTHSVTVTYAENGIEATQTVEIQVAPKPTEPPPTEAATEATQAPEAAPSDTEYTAPVWPLIAITFICFCIAFIIRKSKQHK